MAIKVLRHFDAVLVVDNPETETMTHEVKVRVKKLTLEEMSDYKRDYQRMSDPPSNRMVFVRKPDGEEQERNEKDEYVIPLEAIAARRLAEMTEEQRKKYDAMDAEDEKFARRFISESITKYVTVYPDELTDEDDNPIVTGADLLREFGGNRNVLLQLIVMIWAENTMSAAEKKVRRSLSDLKSSLNRSLLDLLGPTPASVASDAASAASVENAAVTGNPEPTLSGSGEMPNH